MSLTSGTKAWSSSELLLELPELAGVPGGEDVADAAITGKSLPETMLAGDGKLTGMLVLG
jgi:hypothetical protein